MKAIHSKVALDLYRLQINWAIKFLGFFVFLQIARPFVAMIPFVNMNNKINFGNYFDTAFTFGNIFALVVGIIVASSFLTYYVRSGVTRKDFFKGAAIASIGLSISIPIVSSLFYVLLNLFIKFTGFPYMENSELATRVIDIDDGFVGEMIQTIILPPFVTFESSWLLAMALFTLNILTYYVIGWFIGSAFYRFGVPIGLVSILISFIVIYIRDFLLNHAMSSDFSLLVAFLSATAFVVILLWLIKQFTKRLAIAV